MICISCNTDYSTNFCPYCGEKAAVKKITFKSIIEDAFSTLTNMDKGFLYNLKTLFINPKKISIDYILGRRKGILNPISFLILSVTTYLIIENIIRVPTGNTDPQDLPEFYLGKVAYAAGKYIGIYFKYFWILSIIPLALSTKLVFRKYNFTENLAINSFILAQATLIGLVSYITIKIDMVVNPLVYILILWSMYRVFISKKDKLETFFMSCAALVLFILQLVVIGIGIGMMMA